MSHSCGTRRAVTSHFGRQRDAAWHTRIEDGRMASEVALDNCVVFDLVEQNLPENKKKDRLASERIVELARNNVIEIGHPLTGSWMEESHAPGWKRELVKTTLGDVLKTWPAPHLSESRQKEFECKKKCVKEVMPKRHAGDVDCLMVARYSGVAYYITTDYDFLDCFNKRRETIREKCTFDAIVLTPSEFMNKYDAYEV